MSEENAVAIRDGTPESPQSLGGELERRRSEARSLELQLSRKEAELRSAQEEQALMKELRAVNEMIIKKKERKASELSRSKPQQSLKISAESLEELIALEDALKFENKKTTELQSQANVTSRQLEEVEKLLDEKASRLALVKRSTGYDVDSLNAKSGSAALNVFLERKKALTALYDEQRTMKENSDRLTREIEELARAVDEGEQVEESIAAAQEQLEKHHVECGEAAEQVRSYERLRKKKERMLDETQKTDDYKAIRMLESDKRVLHNSLTSLRETNVTNSKSILSLEVRLRQLETRLEAVNLFLRQVFAEVEDDEPIENVEEGATEVPLVQFEELSQELELSRETVAQRDDQLLSHDAKVEQLELKISILQAAIASRTVSAQLHAREKDKETDTLISDMDYLKKSYAVERQRLATENAEIRRKLAAL